MIKTFSNVTYEYQTPGCDHVLMQSNREILNYQENYGSYRSVYMKSRRVNGQQETSIWYRTKGGDSVDIEIENKGIKVNGKMILVNDASTYDKWNDNRDVLLVEAYILSSGEYIVKIDNDNLRVIYDGVKRVLVQPGIYFSGHTQGLCGRMNGEKFYDLASPTNCFFRDHQHFGNSWAVLDQRCDAKTRQLRQQKEESDDVCIRRKWIRPTIDASQNNQDNTTDSGRISSSEEKINFGNNNFGYLTKTYRKYARGNCQLQRQVQLVDEISQICITYTRLPACPKKCNGKLNLQMLPVSI